MRLNDGLVVWRKRASENTCIKCYLLLIFSSTLVATGSCFYVTGFAEWLPRRGAVALILKFRFVS